MIRGDRKNQDRKTAKRKEASAARAAARREAKMAGYRGKVSMADQQPPPMLGSVAPEIGGC
jgi:hypothetical protein